MLFVSIGTLLRNIHRPSKRDSRRRRYAGRYVAFGSIPILMPRAGYLALQTCGFAIKAGLRSLVLDQPTPQIVQRNPDGGLSPAPLPQSRKTFPANTGGSFPDGDIGFHH